QGWVAKLGLTSGPLTLELLGGYASGDGNPFDATVHNFSFNRDYKVGLILFDQVVAWQTAGIVRRATDANVVNYPSAGVDLLSTARARGLAPLESTAKGASHAHQPPARGRPCPRPRRLGVRPGRHRRPAPVAGEQRPARDVRPARAPAPGNPVPERHGDAARHR